MCEAGRAELALTQSRYFPLASKGDAGKTWQIPLCARYEAGGKSRTSCTLLTEREGKLPLEGGACPAWVMPNADGAAYVRLGVAKDDLTKLVAALPKLTTREKLAFANGVRASYGRGTLSAEDTYGTQAALAREAHPALVAEPIGMVASSRT
ncbi:M1 family peptidase, partial [bacterium]